MLRHRLTLFDHATDGFNVVGSCFNQCLQDHYEFSATVLDYCHRRLGLL